MWQHHDTEDHEAPQQIDLEWSDESGDDWIPCPGCGEDISEMAPQCPECGYWITGGMGAERRSRGWFWPIMVGLLVAFIIGVWSGLFF